MLSPRSSLFLLLASATFATALSAEEAVDDPLSSPKFGFTINAAPDQMNQDVDDVQGSSTLNDSAYQYQATAVLSGGSGFISAVKSQYSYVGLRAFRFIDAYEDDCAGASELEGLALFYGTRYMFTSRDYEGLGFGWYAGLVQGTDRWVECDGLFTGEEDLSAPLLVAELFYKWHPADNLFVEPAFLLASNRETGDIEPVAQFNIGLQF